jgi:hypothetical protein
MATGIRDPALAGRAELPEAEAIEQLAEEIGVVFAHLTNS